MIRDATVFDDDHLPATIVGRNRHMNEVTDALSPIEDGFQAENCFLFGPSGAGKTTVARAAVRALRREVLDVPNAYVNCWQDYTRNAALERIAKDLLGLAVPRGKPTSELLNRLRNGLNGPGVIVLDEVDQLRGTELLYDLHSVPGLSWIAVANSEIDLLADLDERTRSRISVGYRVTFDKYDDATITEILRKRARAGLTSGAVTDDTLEEITRLSDGDARTAITALRVAARKAQSEGLSNVPRRIVEPAMIDAKEEVRQKTISKLNRHQRVIYQVIRDDGPLIQKDLYDRYRRVHDDPVSLRYLRETHLRKLEHYNLIATDLTDHGKYYRLAETDRVETRSEPRSEPR